MHRILTRSVALALMSVAFFVAGAWAAPVFADDSDEPGVGPAHELNQAIQEDGESKSKFLPTWLGGAAEQQQSQENEQQFQQDDGSN